MTKDFFKPVAKALANGDNFHDLANKQLAEIEQERVHLQQQATAIRQLIGLYPAPKPVVVHQTIIRSTKPDEPEDETEVSTGLTDPERQAIWDFTYDLNKRGLGDTNPAEIVEMLRQKGLPLNVKHPTSVVATFMYRTRRRLEKNGSDS
jgi:hypothetical protein